MGFLNIFTRTKPEEPVEETCENGLHDWEVVEVSDKYFREIFMGSDFLGEFRRYSSKPWGFGGLCYVPAKNRVCVKCGECDNEIAAARDAVKELERKAAAERKEARRRKMWAKQLWEDGCSGVPQNTR